MLTVRFPDGTAVQYNTATKILYRDHCFELQTKEGNWVASVGYDCLIEASTACRVYNPVKQSGDVIGWLMDHMRRMTWSELGQLAELKLALRDFNAQHRTWK